MSHCDQAISGVTPSAAPAGPVSTRWQDSSVRGSSFGLGCSSNTRLAVCSFASLLGKRTSLRAYRGDGSVAWSSTALNTAARYSVPLIAPDGSAIAADNTRAVRIAADGRELWNVRHAGGSTTSPNVTDDGRIVLAARNGPVSVLDPDSGATLASLRLNATLTLDGRQVSGVFDTFNSPAVAGNRIYVATQFRPDGWRFAPVGRLYAIDVVGTGGGTRLQTAWAVDYAGPGGASPVVVRKNGTTTVVLDGRGTASGTRGRPNFMGVRDEGGAGRIAWSRDIRTPAQAAGTVDPRGGIWVFAPFSTTLERLDTDTGAVIDTLDVNRAVGELRRHGPSSTMTITGPASRPVMLVAAMTASTATSYVLAIDLNTKQTLWKTRTDTRGGLPSATFGQFPILQAPDGTPQVIFSTFSRGVRAIG